MHTLDPPTRAIPTESFRFQPPERVEALASFFSIKLREVIILSISDGTKSDM